MSTHATRALVFLVACVTITLMHKTTTYPPHKETALITVSLLCLIGCLAESACAARPK